VIRITAEFPFPAPGGDEGRGEAGDARAPETARRTPTSLRDVPSPSALKGREDKFGFASEELR
jgi:hypothetical protein